MAQPARDSARMWWIAAAAVAGAVVFVLVAAFFWRPTSVATASSGGSAPSSQSLIIDLAVLYVLVLAIFAIVPYVLDIVLAYVFASQTRTKLIKAAGTDQLSVEELQIIIKELAMAPPGMPGLARVLIAFTIIFILGISMFHLLVHGATIAKDTAASAILNNILSILAGVVAAITGFYFGGKAAETAQRATQADSAPAAGTIVAPSSAGRLLPEGTVVEALDRAWRRIRAAEDQGWVGAQFLCGPA